MKVILVLLNALFTVSLGKQFPWKVFFSMTLFDGNLGDYLCSEPGEYKYCSCSDDCILHNQCCIDKFWDTNSTNGIDKYKKNLITRSKKSLKVMKYTARIPISSLRTINNRSVQATYRTMVASCPSDSNLSLQCTSIGQTQPVVAKSGYFYRNRYCAQCHGVSTYRHINISIVCNSYTPTNTYVTPPSDVDPVPTDSYVSQRRCQITDFERTNPNCSDPDVQYCSNSTHPYYDMCYSYKGIIAGVGLGYFMNYHCFLCNGHNTSMLRMWHSYQCNPDPVTHLEHESLSYISLQSWSVIFNLKRKDYSLLVKEDTFTEDKLDFKYCEKGGILDVKSGKCVPLQCSIGYQMIDNNCVLSTHPFTIIKKDDKPYLNQCSRERFMYIKLIETGNEKAIRNMLMWVTPKYSHKRIMLYKLKFFKNIYYFPLPKNFSFMFIKKVRAILRKKNMSHIKKVVISEIKPKQIKAIAFLGFDLRRIFPKKFYCSKPLLISNRKINRENVCERTHLKENSIIWITKKKAVKSSYRCKQHFMTRKCKIQKLARKNYIIFKNMTLKLLKTNEILNSSSYTLYKGGVGVCVRPKKGHRKPKWKKLFRDAEGYVSIVFTSISVLCYIWFLRSHLKRSKLKSIPQKSIATLCIFLLLTDLTFLCVTFARKNKTTCFSISITWHWLLLITHMMVFFISYDFVTTFRSSLTNTTKSENKFLRYIIIAVDVPTIVVCSLAILDRLSILNVSYGEEGSCWIGNFNARLFSYVLPVACITFVSFVFLLLGTFKIRQVNQANRESTSKNMKKRYSAGKVMLKLVLILGIIEIVGVVQIRRKVLAPKEEIFNAVFQMCFTLLRSSRGIIWIVLYFLKS